MIKISEGFVSDGDGDSVFVVDVLNFQVLLARFYASSRGLDIEDARAAAKAYEDSIKGEI